MDSKDNKFKKPFSPETLMQTLHGDSETYEEIAESCILIATGLDQNQRREARKTLETYVPEGEGVYVASKRIGRIRRRDLMHGCKYWNHGAKELAWTYEGAQCWQIITRIAPNIRTLKLSDGMHYFSMN